MKRHVHAATDTQLEQLDELLDKYEGGYDRGAESEGGELIHDILSDPNTDSSILERLAEWKVFGELRNLLISHPNATDAVFKLERGYLHKQLVLFFSNPAYSQELLTKEFLKLATDRIESAQPWFKQNIVEAFMNNPNCPDWIYDKLSRGDLDFSAAKKQLKVERKSNAKAAAEYAVSAYEDFIDECADAIQQVDMSYDIEGFQTAMDSIIYNSYYNHYCSNNAPFEQYEMIDEIDRQIHRCDFKIKLCNDNSLVVFVIIWYKDGMTPPSMQYYRIDSDHVERASSADFKYKRDKVAILICKHDGITIE